MTQAIAATYGKQTWIWPGRPFSVVFLSCVPSLLLSVTAAAATEEYVQKQGSALARLSCEKSESGRVQIRLSDHIVLKLSIKGASTLDVASVGPIAPSKNWEVSRKSEAERIQLADGVVSWEQTFQLRPLRPGELSLHLPTLRFRQDLSAEQWQTVSWKPISVRVTSEILKADLGQLRDNAPPEELPPPESGGGILYWAAGCSALISVAFVLVWKALRSRAHERAVLPPAEWALQELGRIRGLSLSKQTDVEGLHVELANIMRSYLEHLVNLPACERTTAEFVEAIQVTPQLTVEEKLSVKDFLERCDLVKFARLYPSGAECRALIGVACALVAETRSRAGQEAAGFTGT
jgi:hypothetical protein